MEKKEAYKNVTRLRVRLRSLYRAAGLEGTYVSGMSGLKATQDVVDAWVAGIGVTTTRTQLQEALQKERTYAAAIGQSGLNESMRYAIEDAYKLVQVIPSWDGLPDGETENKLQAIEALLKTSNATFHPEKVLKSIRAIVDPDSLTVPEPPAPKPKSVPLTEFIAAATPAQSSGSAEVHPETGIPVSKYNLKDVNLNTGADPWGYHCPYYMIKKGQPITWGSCSMWVDKDNVKPGKTGALYFVHPEYAAWAQKKYHAKMVANGTLQTKMKMGDEYLAQLTVAQIEKQKEVMEGLEALGAAWYVEDSNVETN